MAPPNLDALHLEMLDSSGFSWSASPCLTHVVYLLQAKWMGQTPKNRRKLRNRDLKKLNAPVSALSGDTVTAHA